MGTSKSHYTPRDTKKKPHDEDKEPLGNSIKQNDNLWRKASTSMSRYINGTGELGVAVSNYGGAKLPDVASGECSLNTETLEKLCALLDTNDYNFFTSKFEKYSKSSLDAFVAELINGVASAGVFREDVASRKALSETFKNIARYRNTIDGFLKELFSNKVQVVTDYIKRYISEQLLTDMSIKIETNCPTASEAIRIENEIKAFISRLNIEFDCKPSKISDSLKDALKVLSI